MKEHQVDSHQTQDDEISLKELILMAQVYWRELWRKWWLIALFCLPFLAYMSYKALTTPIHYPSSLTFMLNDSKGGSLGNVAGILGSFGLGGSSGGGEYNIETMLELLRSRKIMQQVFFLQKEIEGKTDYYANHLIHLYDYHELWKEDTTGLNGFLFTKDSIPAFNLVEKTALKALHARIIGHKDRGIPALLNSTASEETGIMTLKLNTQKEALSIKMLDDIYDTLSDYYVQKTIEKQARTYQAVKFKTDSIFNELRIAEYTLADFKDTNYRLLTKKTKLREVQLEAQVKILYTIYGEALKNLEVAEFSLRDNTPVVQVIDRPLAPLEAVKESLPKAIIMACFIGAFIGAGFVIARKVLKDIME